MGAARWVVTDRSGGVSRPPYDGLDLAGHVGDDPVAVAANRAALARSLAVPVDRLVVTGAVHGREIGWVEGPVPGGDLAGVDALVTATAGLALVALAADCVPLVLVDPVVGLAAVVHAGWRGLAAGVIEATLEVLRGRGARAGQLAAVVGPSICARCYPVPSSRRDQVAARLPAASSQSSAGLPSVDLRAGAVSVLRAHGVAVRIDAGCTAEDPTLYSYRRDGRTGRHGVAVVLDGTP
ncbi:MAG: laccase [Actinomycetota bacterium]|nr:MAG: laccase [Actinomycetota bacterium]